MFSVHVRVMKISRPGAIAALPAVALLSLAAAVAPAAEPITVRGRVFDDGGHGIVGASVTLEPIPDRPAFQSELLDAPPALDAVRTGPGGSFELRAPAPGLLRVTVRAPGLKAVHDLVPVVHDVELADLYPAPAPPLVVRLKDSHGVPVAGAAVVVAGDWDGASSAAPPHRWRPAPRAVVSDAAGRAVLPRWQGEDLALAVWSGSLRTAARAGAGMRELTLVLPAARRQVLEVVTDGGRPAAGWLLAAGREAWPVGWTDDAGRIALRLPVDVRSDGLRAVLAHRDGRAAAVELGAAALPSIVLPDDPATIGGRVVDAAGRPVAGALVWADDEWSRAVVADGSGRFRLLPSRWPAIVFAAAPGYRPPQLLDGVEVRRPPADDVVLRLTAVAALRGEVVDREDRPVAGVFLSITPLDRPRRYRGRRSDEGGRFHFAELEPGIRYRLTASKEGYLLRYLTVAPLDARTSRHQRIVIEPYDRFVGRVVDEDERPVAGARVILRGAVPSGDDRLPPQVKIYPLRSDAGGHFEHRGLFVGEVDMTVEAEGYAPLKVAGVPVERGAGEQDLGTLILPRGAVLAGRVVDPAGAPVAAAEIRARPAESIASLKPAADAPPPSAQATSDEDGHFALRDLLPGSIVDLEVEAAEFTPARLRQVPVAPSAGDEGGEEPLEIVLQPALRLAVRVVDGDGAPLAGARVRALIEDPQATFSGGVYHQRRVLEEATTAADGGVLLRRLEPAARLRVEAVAAGYQRGVSPLLDLTAAEPAEELVLTLRPAAVVRGRVRDPNGEPLAAAEVLVLDGEEPSSSPAAQDTSDAEGRYRLNGLAPGKRTVFARHDRFPATAVTVELVEGENPLDLTFPAGVDVAGRLLDENGEPVVGVAVLLTGAGQLVRPPFSRTDRDGRFRFEQVPDGLYTLVLAGRRYVLRPSGGTLEVRGEPLVGLRLEALPAGIIRGVISGLSFDQLATLELVAYDGRERVAGEVAFDGDYRIDGLTPGVWRVMARLPADGRTSHGEAQVEAGTTARLDLAFTGDGFTLTGRLTAAGQPLGGAGLLLRSSRRSATSRAVESDASGTFRFTGLEAGAYHLELVDPARPGLRFGEELWIDGDRTLQIDLEVHSIGGRVLGDDRPLAGARVSAVPHFGWAGVNPMLTVEVTSGEDGDFVLPVLSAGSWRLSVSHPGYRSGQWDVVVGPETPALVLALDGGGGLAVRVLDVAGRPPASVHLAVTDSLRQTVAGGTYAPDADGLIQLPGVPPGRWLVWASASGSAPVRAAVEVPAEEPPLLALGLGAEIEVVVPALAGSRRRASFFLASPRGEIFGQVAPGGNLRVSWPLQSGRARLAPVAPGRWVIKARTVDGSVWTETAELVAGQLTRVVLED